MQSSWYVHTVLTLHNLAGLESFRRHFIFVKAVLICVVVVNHCVKIMRTLGANIANDLKVSLELGLGRGVAHVPSHFVAKRGSRSFAVCLGICNDVVETVTVVGPEPLEEAVDPFLSVTKHH